MDNITASIIVACQTAGAVTSISKLKYAFAQAARYALDFGQEAISVFSDLEETTQKFDVVFAGMGKKSAGVVKDLIDSYGQSELSAKQMLSATGDLLTGFGLAKDQSLDLAEGAAKLGSDLASFSNYAGGAEGATNALTKAMLGERESLKMLGVVIREDDEAYKNFKKQAMTTGVRIEALGKTFKVSTQQQAQAVATLALAYQQSKNAIGDFARNSESIANQSRTMANRMIELKATIGGLINSILQVGAVQGGLSDVFKNLTDYIKENAEKWSIKIGEFIISMKLGFKASYQMAKNVWQNITIVAGYAWDVITQIWVDFPGFIDAMFEDIRQSYINFFKFYQASYVGLFEFSGKVLISFAKHFASIYIDLSKVAIRALMSIGQFFSDQTQSLLKMAASLGKNFFDLLIGKKTLSEALGESVKDFKAEIKKQLQNQADIWQGISFSEGTKKFKDDVFKAGVAYKNQMATAGEDWIGQSGKKLREYLTKHIKKRGDFASLTDGLDAIIEEYEKLLRNLKNKRTESAAESKSKPAAQSQFSKIRSLGSDVNKMQSNSLQAIMANSLEAIKLQSRNMGVDQYQKVMQTETKKQSNLLNQIVKNTGNLQANFQTQKV